MWAARKPAAWAQVCGKVSGVITLDFDGEAGARTMEQMGLEPHRKTGSGGYHVDFEWPDFPVATLSGKTAASLAQRWPGLDLRGDGGLAIISGTSNTGRYEWLRDIAPYAADALPPELRSYLEDHIRGTSGTSLEAGHYARDADLEAALAKAVADASSMGRNKAGFTLACSARDEGLSINDAQQLLSQFQAQVGTRNMKGLVEAYTDAEIQASIKQAYSRPPRQERPAPASQYARSDAGNGEQLAALYEGMLKYDHKRGRCLGRTLVARRSA